MKVIGNFFKSELSFAKLRLRNYFVCNEIRWFGKWYNPTDLFI